jgi:hypothetical protein
LGKLAAVATGNVLISGGASTASSWGKVGLTTHVSGILPVANGGTGTGTYAIGEILYASAANTLAKLAAGTTGYLLSANGAAAPSWKQNVVSISLFKQGGSPGGTVYMDGRTAVSASVIPVNLVGSAAQSRIPASASGTSWQLWKSRGTTPTLVQVGTISFAASSASGTFSTGAATLADRTVNVGDLLYLTTGGGSSDTLEDVGVTIIANVT